MTLFLAIVTSAVALGWIVLRSRDALRRFARHDRLPMQWGLDGRPTWRAPRAIAVSFTPVLAAVSLAIPLALFAAIPAGSARADESEAALLTVALGMALAYAAAHEGHLWAIRRWDRTQATRRP